MLHDHLELSFGEVYQANTTKGYLHRKEHFKRQYIRRSLSATIILLDKGHTRAQG